MREGRSLFFNCMCGLVWGRRGRRDRRGRRGRRGPCVIPRPGVPFHMVDDIKLRTHFLYVLLLYASFILAKIN